jgi:hypothetical protein
VRTCAAAGEGSLPGLLPYAHKLPLDLHQVPDGDMMMMQVGCVTCVSWKHMRNPIVRSYAARPAVYAAQASVTAKYSRAEAFHMQCTQLHSTRGKLLSTESVAFLCRSMLNGKTSRFVVPLMSTVWVFLF